MSGVDNASFEEIGRVIASHESFAVVSHLRPDGDAIGSALALGEGLHAIGKKVEIINEDGVPDALSFLPCSGRVKRPHEVVGFRPEVAFVLDTAAFSRVGEGVAAIIQGAGTLVNIDHHVSNPGFGDLVLVDSACPATGQIVYELIRALEMPLSEAARDNLWAAISTDTGSFQYPNTTARTFEIGAELIKRGVDVGAISQSLYESYPFRRIELLRELLNVLQISAGGKVASWTLTQEIIRRYRVEPGDSEGLIDIIRSVRGVVVAVFFEEMGEGKVRVSCRSKDPAADVGKICQKFNGGGHRLAAGARMSGEIEEVRERFLEVVYAELEGNN
ncbi:MAG: bifunctional oligoribonuclease/PAP phosphatase NrnA [Verrucomicrobiales bacterium]